jgi:hypothetical protein
MRFLYRIPEPFAEINCYLIVKSAWAPLSLPSEGSEIMHDELQERASKREIENHEQI